MKTKFMLSIVLSIGLLTSATAQSTTGTQTKQAAAKNTPATALKRTGSGKMAEGVSRNGNTNLSPVQPTQPTLTVKPQPKVAVTPKSTKNGTASDGGLTSNGTPRNGANAGKDAQSLNNKKVKADAPKQNN